jgi:hypothetical protein
MLYLSWDAAPWHSSKRLTERLKDLNAQAKTDHAPRLKVIPLRRAGKSIWLSERVLSKFEEGNNCKDPWLR